MVNMAVEWAGPNGSLATLAPELNARFGKPTRPYEYVTGYKSATNVSGHNADANGRGHSMDIFVGVGQNISVEQGIDLAERLRLEGKRGSIPGHPDRLAYIIHRGRIAGDHTNWEWVKYNGIADHYDHIHISSVFDYFWGDPVVGNPLDYNSTAAWNLWGIATLAGQNSAITPITEEDFLMALPEADQVEVVKNVRKLVYGQQSQDKVVAALTTQVGQLSTQLEEVVGNARKAVYGIQDVKAGLAALPAKDIAAAIPDDLARQVIDALAERLGK